MKTISAKPGERKNKCAKTLAKIFVAGILGATPVAFAGSVNNLTAFQPGTVIKSAEMNGNFAAVKTAVDDNDARITALIAEVNLLKQGYQAMQAANQQLQQQVAALNASSGFLNSLKQIVSIQDESHAYATQGGKKVTFTGANIYIQSGSGSTDDNLNFRGLGNLIIGYNESRGFNHLSTDERTGSHNLVLGTKNNYTRVGGIVSGTENSVKGYHSAVIGGLENTADSNISFSVLIGGLRNRTYGGMASAIVGGWGNTVSAMNATITGGFFNEAGAVNSSIAGGSSHKIIVGADQASISGGSNLTLSTSGSWAAGIPTNSVSVP